MENNPFYFFVSFSSNEQKDDFLIPSFIVIISSPLRNTYSRKF